MLEVNKIYNMDCLEGMKMMEDNSVDITFTSPPYNDTGTKNEKVSELKSNNTHTRSMSTWNTEKIILNGFVSVLTK